jgi:2-amino-4-hydroxy-6-hydroxymethyldihydropteridine diphosphokinase
MSPDAPGSSSTRVAIGLGSNLGDRRALLDEAVAHLASAPGLRLLAVSPYRETSPVGGPPGQGPFLNAAATFECALTPDALLAVLHQVEAHAGRTRDVRWDARTLDLDLLLYGDLVQTHPALTLPHPRMLVRRFVLDPLAQIAPDWRDPMTGHSIETCLAHLDRRPRYLALHAPAGNLLESVLRQLLSRLGALTTTPETVLDPPPADTLANRALDLDAADWPPERAGDRWLVTPYCLDLDYRLSRRATIARNLQPPRTNGHPPHSDPDADHELELRVRSALSPTFAVVLPSPGQPPRAPGLADFPIFWPDTTDPDRILTEIVAACQSTGND